MATGGAGDTLTGIIGSLLAQNLRIQEKEKAKQEQAEQEQAEQATQTEEQGKQAEKQPAVLSALSTSANLSDLQAVALAVYVHGLAGDSAAQEVGEAGLVAGDIIAHLGRVLRQLEEAC